MDRCVVGTADQKKLAVVDDTTSSLPAEGSEPEGLERYRRSEHDESVVMAIC